MSVSQLARNHAPAPQTLAKLVVNATMDVFPALHAVGMATLDQQALFEAPLTRCALRSPALPAAAAVQATGMGSVLEVAALHWWCTGFDDAAPVRQLLLWLVRQWGDALSTQGTHSNSADHASELASRLLLLSGDSQAVDALVQVRHGIAYRVAPLPPHSPAHDGCRCHQAGVPVNVAMVDDTGSGDTTVFEHRLFEAAYHAGRDGTTRFDGACACAGGSSHTARPRG